VEEVYQGLVDTLSNSLPNLLAAIAVLFIGWLAALLIAAMVKAVVRRIGLSRKVADWLPEEEKDMPAGIERGVSKGVFYLLMLLVLVAFFQTLGITSIIEPFNSLLNRVFQFIPNLLGAAILLLVAWIIASLVRLLISRTVSTMDLDKKLEVEGNVPLSKSISDILYWLILFLFLPAILGALTLDGLLVPAQAMLDKVLSFLPNIFAGGVILLAGWLFARIARKAFSNLMSSMGVDEWSDNVSLSAIFGEQKLSGTLGLILYILILIPVLIAVLNALELSAITGPASNMLNSILDAIPNILVAALLLVLAYMVGKVAAKLVANLLEGIGFNSMLQKVGFAKETSEGQETTPALLVEYLILITIMLFAVIEAANILGFDALGDLVSQFMVTASHILLGLAILALGLYFAQLAASAISSTDFTNAGFLSVSARLAIVILSGAIALRQMGLANEIINLAFGIFFGCIAVAAAISFGLGGREIAARELEKWISDLKSKKAR
jgi:hypothetical protein